jgi:hypothetical protein
VSEQQPETIDLAGPARVVDRASSDSATGTVGPSRKRYVLPIALFCAVLVIAGSVAVTYAALRSAPEQQARQSATMLSIGPVPSNFTFALVARKLQRQNAITIRRLLVPPAGNAP